MAECDAERDFKFTGSPISDTDMRVDWTPGKALAKINKKVLKNHIHFGKQFYL